MAFDRTKPQNTEKLKDTPALIRANWDAIAAGTDPELLITNAKVSPTAGIADTKLAQITTAGKVSGAALTSLASIPSGAGDIPKVNLDGNWDTDGTLAANSDDKIPTQKAVKTYVDGKATSIETVYPIGSIYISTVSTNPNTLFGFGTWEAFGAGRTLVGLNSADADFDTSEEMGGSKTVSTPAHIHTLDVGNKGGDVSDGVQSDGTYMWNEGGDTYYSNTVKITTVSGGSGNVSVVQPYITVYMWKRTA